MKCCKIYCTYFGDRRGKAASGGPGNAKETLDVFSKVINNDIIIDHGVSNLDIIIINNESTTITNECSYFLDSLDGSSTNLGQIKVFHRENVGGCLGAFSYAFDRFEDEYDYWFFSEDDIMSIYPGYYRILIDEFTADESLGFLSYTLINNEDDPNRRHVSGGYGGSKREVLKKVKNAFGFLPYDRSGMGYGGHGQGETLFTNCYIKLGYTVRLPNYDEAIFMADNWQVHPPLVLWQKKHNFKLNKPFVWHIG